MGADNDKMVLRHKQHDHTMHLDDHVMHLDGSNHSGKAIKNTAAFRGYALQKLSLTLAFKEASSGSKPRHIQALKTQ